MRQRGSSNGMSLIAVTSRRLLRILPAPLVVGAITFGCRYILLGVGWQCDSIKLFLSGTGRSHLDDTFTTGICLLIEATDPSEVYRCYIVGVFAGFDRHCRLGVIPIRASPDMP